MTAVNCDASAHPGYIGSYAFSGCTSLKNCSLLDDGLSVFCIDDRAFSGSSVKDVKLNVIGKSYTSNEEYEGCALTEKSTGPYLGESIFEGCTSLTSVKFLKSNEIGPRMFYGCTSLNNVQFSQPYGSCVGSEAFVSCTSLASITFPTNFEIISERMFANCSKLATVSIPANATKFTNIEASAFMGCTKLTSLTLPTSVVGFNDIDDSAFAGSSISSIHFNGVQSETIYQYVGRVEHIQQNNFNNP